MLPDDQYPLSPARQHLLLIAASPGDSLAEALAHELRRYGWTPVVTDHVEAYAAEAQACVVPLAPTSLNSPAVSSALNVRLANLIPLVMTPMAPPYAPWVVAPIGSMGSADQDGAAIHRALVGVLGPAAPMPSVPMPSAAPYPSTYGAQPTYPMGYPGNQTYPGFAGYAAAPPPQNAPPRRKGRLALLFTAIGGFALLICVLGGLYAYHVAGAFTPTRAASATVTATTPAPSPTATLPPGFSRYVDPSGAFQISRPTNWTQSVSHGDLLFDNPTKTADLVIGHVAGTATSADITLQETGFFKDISTSAGGNGSYNHFQGPDSVPMAGETWTRESADIPVRGVTIHAVVNIANHNGSSYIIAYGCLKSDFSSLDAHTYQPMLHSFTFLM